MPIRVVLAEDHFRVLWAADAMAVRLRNETEHFTATRTQHRGHGILLDEQRATAAPSD